MIEMGNEKIVTGRPKNHHKSENQYITVISGLPSQNQKEDETQEMNVNHQEDETHILNVKRMVGWSIPPTVKFTVTPIPKVSDRITGVDEKWSLKSLGKIHGT